MTLSADKKTYWTLIQAVAWVTTRRMEAVEHCGNVGQDTAVGLIFWMEMAKSRNKSRGIEKVGLIDAEGNLLEQLKDGSLAARGKFQIEQETQMIPADAWDDMSLDLHHSNRHVRPELKWRDILVRRKDVVSLWPKNANEEKKSSVKAEHDSKEKRKEKYCERVRDFESRGDRSSREDDEKWFSELFPNQGSARPEVRHLRETSAPEHWLKPGPRPKKK